MDMGFSREHAMEALLNTSTMEQATEYLLTHPPPLLGGAVRVRIPRHKHKHFQSLSLSEVKFRQLTLLSLFHLGHDYVWRGPDDEGHCNVTRARGQHGAALRLSWGVSPSLHNYIFHNCLLLSVTSWMNNLPFSQAAVEIIYVCASGSSTSARGRGQESQGAGRGGGGPLLGALHGGWATGPQGASFLHWCHAAWLLPSSGWAAWHSLQTLWPADDCH